MGTWASLISPKMNMWTFHCTTVLTWPMRTMAIQAIHIQQWPQKRTITYYVFWGHIFVQTNSFVSFVLNLYLNFQCCRDQQKNLCEDICLQPGTAEQGAGIGWTATDPHRQTLICCGSFVPSCWNTNPQANQCFSRKATTASKPCFFQCSYTLFMQCRSTKVYMAWTSWGLWIWLWINTYRYHF
jgi:hypothetical protein